ncbi:hypothetical protein MAR_020495 [Mya arenaria]|uniref:Uncharacterized protein n=1 Tax=Mya arenaria TaxID=6604 RepID=A0ABY7ED98_MYAAR|nr:hypothetical protein MAR_020495 [Mya arenaria]
MVLRTNESNEYAIPECPLPIGMHLNEQMTVCNIQDSCTAVDVCVHSDTIGRNIHMFLYLDACNQILSIGIENFKFIIPFTNVQWGIYTVIHLPVRNVFVVDLGFYICWKNSDCEHNITIFDKVELPILPCSWQQGFLNSTFSYQTWLASKGYAINTLSDGQRKELFDDLGIGRYIRQRRCFRSTPPYGNSELGWNSECQSYVDLPPLRSVVTCHLNKSCTSIKCCLDVEDLKSSVQFEINIDACNKEIHVVIEALHTTRYMQFYEYGELEAFHLGGVLRMDFIIENFDRGRKFSISLNISVCLESDATCLSEQILDQHIFPKTDCDWRNGFNVKGFSLYDWKELHSIQANEPLTPTQSDILMNHLGIAPYLLSQQCQTTDNWTNECPFHIHVNSISNEMLCHIDTTCLNIDCCIHIESVMRNVHVFVHIDDCEMKIDYGIEGIKLSKSFEGFIFEFSLADWIAKRFQTAPFYQFDRYMLTTLLEDLGIAEALLPTRCVVETSDYIDTSSCPIYQSIQSLSTNVSCSLSANCIGIHCCLNVSELPLSFDFSIDIDNCKEEMTVRIEKLRYIVLFKDILWGNEHFLFTLKNK